MLDMYIYIYRYLYHTIYNNRSLAINFAHLSLCHISHLFPNLSLPFLALFLPIIPHLPVTLPLTLLLYVFFSSHYSLPYCNSSSNLSYPFFVPHFLSINLLFSFPFSINTSLFFCLSEFNSFKDN